MGHSGVCLHGPHIPFRHIAVKIVYNNAVCTPYAVQTAAFFATNLRCAAPPEWDVVPMQASAKDALLQSPKKAGQAKHQRCACPFFKVFEDS